MFPIFREVQGEKSTLTLSLGAGGGQEGVSAAPAVVGGQEGAGEGVG